MKRFASFFVLALAAFAFAVAPVAAQQQWNTSYNLTTERHAGFVVLVEQVDPQTGAVTYSRIKFADLLDGVVTFPDDQTRFVAVLEKTTSQTEAPALTPAQAMAGNSRIGTETGIAVPDRPAGATEVWLYVVVPDGEGLPYASLSGSGNSGFNSAASFTEQADTIVVTVGGVNITYEVWVTTYNAAFLPGLVVYLSQAAVSP